MNEYNVGDLVEASKDKSVIRGLLVKEGYGYTHDGLGVDGLGWGLDSLSSNGFTITVIEKAAPGLPTEPGYYFDKDGDVEWLDPKSPTAVRNLEHSYAPWTRLEVAAVTEAATVEKIAAWLESPGNDQRPHSARLIRAKFGTQ